MKPKAYSQKARNVEVTADRERQRLDNFLARELKDLPKNALYRLIRTGQVRVNGGRARPDRKLVAGDTVRLPPVVTQDRGEFQVSKSVLSQVEESILFENGDFMVIDKPSGMAVHGGSGLPWGLIDAVRQTRPDEFVELVHRIDRETSGCLVLARNGETLRDLAEQFRQGSVAKQYLCLMNGRLKEDQLVVDAPIVADRESGEKVMRVDESGRRSVTRFTRIHQYETACYAQAVIETGRTHQIRVHASHLGTPLAGDRKYSSARQQRYWRKLGLRRIFLHASGIEFESRDGTSEAFNAPLPPALRRCLDKLEGAD